MARRGLQRKRVLLKRSSGVMGFDGFQNIEGKLQGCTSVLTGDNGRVAAADSMKERLQLQPERLAGRDLEPARRKCRSGMAQFSREKLCRFRWPRNCVIGR